MWEIFVAVVIVGLVNIPPVPGEPVEVGFIRGVKRLNIADQYDYYFSCSIVGQFLQWQLNSKPLNSFRRDSDIGGTVVIQAPDFTHTSTLLSSEPVGSTDLLAMDSFLMVTFTSEDIPSNFAVTCSNGPISRTEVAGSVVNPALNQSTLNNDTLILNYISSSHMLSNRTMNIHVFMCGTQHSFQQLEASSAAISFSTDDQIGSHEAPLATTYSVREQGIFIARSPFMTTSIMIITSESEEVSVSCFYGTNRVTLQSQSPDSESNTSATENGMSTTDMVTIAFDNQDTAVLNNNDTLPDAIDTTSEHSGSASNNVCVNIALLASVIATSVVFVVIVVIILPMILMFNLRKSKAKYQCDYPQYLFYNKPDVLVLQKYSKNNPYPVTEDPTLKVYPSPPVLNSMGPVCNSVCDSAQKYEGNWVHDDLMSPVQKEVSNPPDKEVNDPVHKKESDLVDREATVPVQNDLKTLAPNDEHHPVQNDFRMEPSDLGTSVTPLQEPLR